MKKVVLSIVLFVFLGVIYAQDTPNFNNSDCKIRINGLVKDMMTGEIIPNASVKLFLELKLVDSLQAGKDGTFSFSVACNKRYVVNAKAENYAERPLTIFSSTRYTDKIWEIPMVPIREFRQQNHNKIIDVDSIEFLEDSDEFMPDALKELSKVITILKRYPHIKVSINVHSDSKGLESYNLKITQERADNIMSYLISKGIDDSRLSAVGFGSKQLLNACSKNVKCSEAEHKINRRVEFVVN